MYDIFATQDMETKEVKVEADKKTKLSPDDDKTVLASKTEIVIVSVADGDWVAFAKFLMSLRRNITDRDIGHKGFFMDSKKCDTNFFKVIKSISAPVCWWCDAAKGDYSCATVGCTKHRFCDAHRHTLMFDCQTDGVPKLQLDGWEVLYDNAEDFYQLAHRPLYVMVDDIPSKYDQPFGASAETLARLDGWLQKNLLS